MTIHDLIQAAKEYQPSEEDLKRHSQLVEEYNDRFQRKALDKRITNEWLNITYSI